MISKKRISILLMALFVFLIGIDINYVQAKSEANITSERKALIKKYFGESTKVSSETKERWRRAAVYGDPSVQHDLGIFLITDGELEEAKKWFKKAARNGCTPSIRRLRQIYEIEEIEEQNRLKKQKQIEKKANKKSNKGRDNR